MKIPKFSLKKRIQKIKLRERKKTARYYIDKHAEEIKLTLAIKDSEHENAMQKIANEYERKLRLKDEEIKHLNKRDLEREADYKNFLIHQSRLERQAGKFKNITKNLVEDVKEKFIEFQRVVDEVDNVIFLENKQRIKRG